MPVVKQTLNRAETAFIHPNQHKYIFLKNMKRDNYHERNNKFQKIFENIFMN